MALLEIKNLDYSCPTGEKILKNVNLQIEAGDFVALCGPTGSGKTTLLRMLKQELAPLGDVSGEVLFDGVNINSLNAVQSARTGFVQQSPDHQIVTDRVRHELAFGMESLCFSQKLMSRRIAEASEYFGISALLDKSTDELSGGQKQLVSLASVFAMNPDVIILDEPTSQLDPVAASEFITTLRKLNEDMGVTIIIAEHRLENILPVCNKMAVIEKGSITAFGDTRTVVSSIRPDSALFAALSGSARLWHLTKAEGICPLSVAEGRKMLADYEEDSTFTIDEEYNTPKIKSARLDNVYFRYSRPAADVLSGVSLDVYENEILCVLGANGSGKTTLLYALAGLVKSYSGKIEIFGKNIKKYQGNSLWNNCVAMLAQDASSLFLCNTLEEEFKRVGAGFADTGFDLSYASKTHPFDLSGGEQQLAALTLALAAKPEMLLLDEPSKGLDPNAKQMVASALKTLKSQGKTVVCVTHDVEFAAMCADRAAMLFEGRIVCTDTPHKFFGENIFYTTAINKITSHISKSIITYSDAEKFFGGRE